MSYEQLENAARQALEALGVATTPLAKDRQEVLEAIASLRQALEQQANQEPVAWMYDWEAEGVTDWLTSNYDEAHSPTMGCTNIRPLFTEPPKLQPLTDEELVAAYISVGDKEWAIGGMRDATKFARAIEAKLKELNT